MARIPIGDAKDLFEFTAFRDGEKCRYSGPLCKGSLMLHHVDNNPKNNNPSNLAIVCRGHNHRLNPRGRDKRHEGDYIKEWRKGRGGGGYKQKEILAEIARMGGEKGYEDPIRRRITSAEMEKNNICEPAFRNWVEDVVMKMGKVKASELINGGAEKVGCSQQTTKKYLEKMCSIAGRYQYSTGIEDGDTCVEFKSEVARAIYGNGSIGVKQGPKKPKV